MTSSSSASASAGPVASFNDIVDILKPRSQPSAFSSPIPSSTAAAVDESTGAGTIGTQRGYAPSSLPPRTDPVLDLMTNLLMKHGKKAEAQSMVARVLSLL